jgi:hypothetical protein
MLVVLCFPLSKVSTILITWTIFSNFVSHFLTKSCLWWWRLQISHKIKWIFIFLWEERVADILVFDKCLRLLYDVNFTPMWTLLMLVLWSACYLCLIALKNYKFFVDTKIQWIRDITNFVVVLRVHIENKFHPQNCP